MIDRLKRALLLAAEAHLKTETESEFMRLELTSSGDSERSIELKGFVDGKPTTVYITVEVVQ